MVRIDFVPNDYIERKESHRANFFYLALLVLTVAAIAGAFGVIKFRQHTVDGEAKAVDIRMSAVQQSIKQLEQIHIKRQEMMETAMLTAELIEPAPRSVIIALLTNFLPDNVSLLRIEMIQKKVSPGSLVQQAKSKYEAIKAAAAQNSQGQNYITELEIEGLAASDIGVADYIAVLSNSAVLENVCLVQSKQMDSTRTSYREFKLTAQIRRDFTINDQDVEKIRHYRNIKNMSKL
ncbi:MAG: PilN domain-containing protein [Phycisphaerae bacterium]|nr:PilN domain-containing protein [Phycisphaerae bacterium]